LAKNLTLDKTIQMSFDLILTFHKIQQLRGIIFYLKPGIKLVFERVGYAAKMTWNFFTN
jgi:hypothetical protein